MKTLLTSDGGCPLNTPWGRADHVKELIDGIWHVSTPSHGGLWVSPELHQRMPIFMQSTDYSQGGWFEEDCDWCLPYIVFETEFRQSTDEATKRILAESIHMDTFKAWHPKRYAQFVEVAR